jgi:hypothetical protein
VPGYGPLPNVPGVIKVVVTSLGVDLRKAETVLHWGYTGSPPTPAVALAAATAFWNAWVADIMPQSSSTLSLTTVQVTDLSISTGAQAVYTHAGVPVAGTLAGGILPMSCAMLLNKQIPRLYRGGHPRMYLCVGDTTKLLSDGFYTTAFAALVLAGYISVQTAFDGLVSGATTIGSEVTVSYIDKAVNPVFPYRRPVPAVFNVTGVTAQGQMATQRRRVRRTARHK